MLSSGVRGSARPQQPLTHLPLWSRLARFTLGTEDARLWGSSALRGGGTHTAPQELTPHPPRVTPAPYLLALHPREAVNAGVTLKRRRQSCETPTSTESPPPHPAVLELLLLRAQARQGGTHDATFGAGFPWGALEEGEKGVR